MNKLRDDDECGTVASLCEESMTRPGPARMGAGFRERGLLPVPQSTEDTMAEPPEHADLESGQVFGLPIWTHSSRLTKEQLEAAERTRAYHLRKLQGDGVFVERGTDGGARSEA